MVEKGGVFNIAKIKVVLSGLDVMHLQAIGLAVFRNGNLWLWL